MMKTRTRLLLSAVLLLLSAQLPAATVKWILPTVYDKVDRFTDRLYLISKGSLFGLADADGRVVLEPVYNFITPFVNGYSLVCTGTNQKARLVKVIDIDGHISDITGNYFVDPAFPYFSEGLMCVTDASGKYGYITPGGKTAIPFRYSKALPFGNGWAPVRDGRLFRYISRDDGSPLVVNFNYGEMTAASVFRDGQAVVAYNKKFAIIGTNGKVLRELSSDEGQRLGAQYNAAPEAVSPEFARSQRFTSKAADGRYSILDNGRAIVGNIFNGAPVIYSDNVAVVGYGQGYGLLRIIEGEYRADISAAGGVVKVDTDDNPSAVDYKVTIPDGISPRDITLWVDNGSGYVKTAATATGRVIAGSVIPSLAPDAGECAVAVKASYGDIPVMARTVTFPVEYATRVTVGAPHLTSAKADEYGYQTVVATVRNESSRPAQVRVTLGGVTFADGKDTFYITVPGKGSYTVSSRVYVDRRFEATVTVTTSTGARSAASLTFDTYF